MLAGNTQRNMQSVLSEQIFNSEKINPDHIESTCKGMPVAMPTVIADSFPFGGSGEAAGRTTGNQIDRVFPLYFQPG